MLQYVFHWNAQMMPSPFKQTAMAIASPISFSGHQEAPPEAIL